MSDQVAVNVTHIDMRKHPHLRDSINPNYVVAAYGMAGERITDGIVGQCVDMRGERPPTHVIADSLAPSWPGMRVCVWLDLTVWPAERLADNVVPPVAIGST
jgi:hypothetical protein